MSDLRQPLLLALLSLMVLAKPDPHSCDISCYNLCVRANISNPSSCSEQCGCQNVYPTCAQSCVFNCSVLSGPLAVGCFRACGCVCDQACKSICERHVLGPQCVFACGCAQGADGERYVGTNWTRTCRDAAEVWSQGSPDRRMQQ